MSMITVIGNLVADPESKVAAGHNIARLRVATNERVKDSDGSWRDGDTTYIDITCWRKLADGVTGLKKGQRVVVYGKLKGRSFQRKDGTNGYAYEIEATDVGASVMARGTSQQREVEPDLDNPWG